MLKSLLIDIVLRQVPEHLVSGVRSGDLKVYGSIIRSISEGRIVGHLQETGGLSSIASMAMSGPEGLAIQVANLGVDAVGHTVSYVQNEQIKAAIATVQNLQIAGLALGAVGIGVSVAGFAVLSKKIGRVEAKVDSMADKLDAIARGIDALRRDRINEDFVRLRTAAERMDEGWQLADPEPQWRAVAGDMHQLQNAFAHRANELLGAGPANMADVEPFAEALALAASVRVSARLAAGDEVVARRAAEEGASVLHSLGGRYRVADASVAKLRAEGVEAGTPQWGEALERAAHVGRSSASTMRAREAAAASTVMTLEELDRRQIAGRTWMEAARNADEPVLFLPASS